MPRTNLKIDVDEQDRMAPDLPLGELREITLRIRESAFFCETVDLPKSPLIRAQPKPLPNRFLYGMITFVNLKSVRSFPVSSRAISVGLSFV